VWSWDEDIVLIACADGLATVKRVGHRVKRLKYSSLQSLTGVFMGYARLIVILFLLLPFLYAVEDSDNSRYCALMMGIYGSCSEELISNYLMMTARPVMHRQVIREYSGEASAVIIPVVNGTINGSDVPTVNQSQCWYHTPWGWKQCRLLS